MIPEIGKKFNDGIVYRIEKYGIFIYFNENKSEGMIHNSKFNFVNPMDIQTGDKMAVIVTELKDGHKVGLALQNEHIIFKKDNDENKNKKQIPVKLDDCYFPDLNNVSDKIKEETIIKNITTDSTATTASSSKAISTPWGSNLNKIKEKPAEKITSKPSCTKCDYSGEEILIKQAIKAQTAKYKKIHYFKSLYDVKKFNDENDICLKVLNNDGSLEILPTTTTINIGTSYLETKNNMIIDKDELVENITINNDDDYFDDCPSDDEKWKTNNEDYSDY
jgi:predicted RNA-binding protein with RPS1 domain